MSEFIYGCLLGLQLSSILILQWSIDLAFIMLMIACFGKGMLYQYEHFKEKETSPNHEK